MRQALKTNVLTAIEMEEMWERRAENPLPRFYAGSSLRIYYKPRLDSDAVRTSV